MKLRKLAIVTALVGLGTLASSAAWATHDSGNQKSQDWHSNSGGGGTRVTAFEPAAGALAALGLGAALLLRRRRR